MVCPGIVTNVTNFGAFVDIGVHQDGLVHISELSNQFVSDPRELASPGDLVKVKVLGVDEEKGQISLSMKFDKPAAKTGARRKPNDKGKSAKGKKGGKPKGKGGPRKGGGGGKRPPKKPANPFNNPFAALNDIKNN